MVLVREKNVVTFKSKSRRNNIDENLKISLDPKGILNRGKIFE
jgi:FAD/FMN-containing dehydrogenase